MTRIAHDNIIIEKFRLLPRSLLGIAALLSFIGLSMLFSAAKGNIDPWASRQFYHVVLGMLIMLIIALIDIRFWFKTAYAGYIFGLMLLLLVDVVGVTGMGAQRWINIGGFRFQPSELMKVLLVISLARYFHMLHLNNVKRLSSLSIPALLIAVSALLVLRQPNLGTTIIMVATSVSVIFMSGVGWKKFVVAGVLVIGLMPLAWNHLHDYQKQRVYTFLNPESDPLGAGYNIIQSKIAIGSGGIWGKGFLNGTQSQLSFVPEKQTDFIFSIIAEEFGLWGGIVIIALFILLILSSMKIGLQCQNRFGRLMAFGITTIFFLHAFINIGMVMGILPVVGVPLPLLSYGGSSMISTWIGIGFICNAHIHAETKISRD